ncbi:winged helix DNA-binding domain-containing protein [Nocardioides nanhaiensis]|uniref:Winged helix DNA-binding domain-containing protein n=1 Tax=Nocardioides nanhaiensis TaxID=1476871 RepID=A0ABP8W477_9ACTN
MREFSDDERRRRLLVRHRLTAATRAATPEEATEAVGVLHSTEPATVYLSVRVRAPHLGVDDVDRALHRDRTLVKQLAMRRTLFVFPRALLPAAWGSAAARVAATERAGLVKGVESSGLATDGAAWVEERRAEIVAAVAATPSGLTAVEVREAVPGAAVQVSVPGGVVPAHTRLLTHLGLTADLVRGENTQHWRLSRPRWAPMESWLGAEPVATTSAQGYAELVRTWLERFAPGTEEDLVWWLGATKGAVRAALTEVGAVAVQLEDGGPAWVLPGDEETHEDPGPEPHVALLPVLDPTVMGWRGRDWYLEPALAARLFDRNGNAGTTAWVDGRAVGCWVQGADGVVHVAVEPSAEVSPAARAALQHEAEQLGEWLDGERVGTVYPSPAMKDAREQLGEAQVTRG